jgi:hypothetical protein
MRENYISINGNSYPILYQELINMVELEGYKGGLGTGNVPIELTYESADHSSSAANVGNFKVTYMDWEKVPRIFSFQMYNNRLTKPFLITNTPINVSSADLNTLTGYGTFYCTGTTLNRPPGTQGNGSLQVIPGTDGDTLYQSQIWTTLSSTTKDTVSYIRRFYKIKKDGTPLDATGFISDWEILGGKASLWLNNSTPLTSDNIRQYVIPNIKFYKKISLQFSPNDGIDVYRVELEKQRRQGNGTEGRFQGTYSFTNELNITQTFNVELGFDENTQKCNYFLVYITRVDIGNTGDISGSVITASSQLTEIWGLSL